MEDIDSVYFYVPATGIDGQHGVCRRATARRIPPRSWESVVKIKVKKVERIEATRIHLDPDPPQGAA